MGNGPKNGKSYKVTKTNDGWLVKEDNSRTRGVGASLSPAATRAVVIFLAAVFVFGIIFSLGDIIKDKSFKSATRYSDDKFVLTIIDKPEPTEESKYENGFITAFEINVKNNSRLSVMGIQGELVIYNASGDVLDTSVCSFDCNLESKKEKSFIVNFDREYGEKAKELYYSDIEDLRATFSLTKVIYEGNKIKEYTVDPVVVLELSEDSDGVSATEKLYQKALYLFRQRKYSEALPMLRDLGEYKNSAEIIEEIITTVETNAEKLATSGDYKGACKALTEIGYNENNNDIYHAYLCASQGNFVDAVNYGLPIIFIPEGTKAIPDDFLSGANASSLIKVVLPSSIEAIGKSAFLGCAQLAEINFPDGLLTIGEEAFNNCGLKELKLPNTVKTIDNMAFANNEQLTSVEIPSSVVTFGEMAFYGCTGLTSVTIPGNIKTISKSAFSYCNGLVEVTISEGVEIIDESAFENCSNLTTVTLPKSLKVIGKYSFGQCASIKEITIPVNVNDIQTGAFGGCYDLESMKFERTDGWIENSAVSVSVNDPQENAREALFGNSWERQ